MATARPFAYNPGEPISGTEQVGDIAIGTPDVGFELSGAQFWNGPDEELGYVVCLPVPLNTQHTPVPGVSASVRFIRSEDLTDNSFRDLINSHFNQNFLTATACKSWLTANGYWTSWGSLPSGMVLYLDAGLTSSYPGSGSTWYDLSGYNNHGTINEAVFSSEKGGVFEFDGVNDNISFGTVSNIPIGNEPYTISVWFRSNEMPSNRGFVGWGEFGSSNQVNAWRLRDNGGLSGFRHYWWGNDLDYDTPMDTNTWYNAVAAYENGTRNLYLNNVLVASDNPTGHNVQSADNLRIGVTAESLNEWFDGQIGQVIIYKRQASVAEVSAIYNSGLERFVGSTPGPTQSGFTITITESGSDVVMSGSGTLNINDLTLVTSSAGPLMGAGLGINSATFILGANGGYYDQYGGLLTNPNSFGSGTGLGSNSSSGDIVGVIFDMAPPHMLVVPTGYVSGTYLTSSQTFNSQTLTSLGLVAGTYSYTWGTGSNADSLVVVVGGTSSPGGGGGGGNLGEWYFYSDEGNINVGAPIGNGNAIFTISGSPVVETYNPNGISGTTYLAFSVNNSTGTSRLSEFSQLQTSGGTINITQNGQTATFTSNTPGPFFIDNQGGQFLVFPAAIQTATTANPFVYGVPITITIS